MCIRVQVKALSFIVDKAFSSFDKSGFLTSKQKWQIILSELKRVATIYTLENDKAFLKS